MNNGGLYGERAGWSLPGYPDLGWRDLALPSSSAPAGVGWYRTTFDLDVSKGVDASNGLTIADDPAKAYRAVIFVNGWNLGQYINNVGPQHTFVLPNGILDPDGTNTLAIAVTANDVTGGLGSVSLTNLGTVLGGASLTLVDSPSYHAPKVASTIVDRGDGTQSQAQLAGTGPTRQVFAEHTWGQLGQQQVTVSLSDTYGPTLATGRSWGARVLTRVIRQG